jgi:hypothetical protein
MDHELPILAMQSNAFYTNESNPYQSNPEWPNGPSLIILLNTNKGTGTLDE